MQAYSDIKQAQCVRLSIPWNTVSATVPAVNQSGHYNASYSLDGGFIIRGPQGSKVFKTIENTAVKYVSAHHLLRLRKRAGK